MAWPLEATQGRAVFRDERNYLDPRTARLRMVWQSFNSAEHPNLPKRTTASASAYAADVANTRQGQYAYLLDGSGGAHATFRPVSVDGTRLYSIEPAERSGIIRVNVLPQLGGQTFRGIPRLLNGQLTKFDPYHEVVIQSAGQTHTLRFSDAAGGMLTYWRVQIPASSVDVQVLNRGNSYLRGLQGSATWVDSQRNSLHRHSPMQGGSYYSAGSGVGAADQHYAQGSVLVDFQRSGNTITVSSQPLELDPDGAMAIPGVGSGHGGGQYAPVIWKDMKITTQLTMHVNGVEGIHKLVTTVDWPFSVRSAWFDMSQQAVLFLDAGVFNNLRAFDSSGGVDTLLSNGLVGGAYYKAEHRRYSMAGAGIFGDDEGNIAAPLFESEGAVAGVRTADNLAVGIYTKPSRNPVEPASGPLVLNDKPYGNIWVWAQNRAGASGIDGDNAVMLSCPAELSTRWHDNSRPRDIEAGSHSVTTWLFTGIWADMKTKLQAGAFL